MDREVAGPSASAPGWRDDDEALWTRLSNEHVARLLWAAQAPPGAGDPPARAHVLVRAVRALPGAAEAIEAAERADVRKLVGWIAKDRYAGMDASYLHAVAVWFDRLAAAWSAAAERGATAPGLEADEIEASARVRSAAAWIALGEERMYLAALGRRLAGAALPPEEGEAAALGAAAAFFDDLERAATDASRRLDRRGRVALATLARIGEACRMAGVDAPAARRSVQRADATRARVVDAALATASDALSELRAREDGPDLAAPHLARVRDVWEWSGRDVAVESFVVEQVTHFGWEIYRAAGWPRLRALLAPCAPIFESLEARILRDPSGHVAWAAGCAQMFVFMSEAETNGARELALAERALRICPSHRNARLVLAYLLCDRATGVLERSTFLTARGDVPEAERLIKRAEDLFPQSSRLPQAKQKLAEVKGRWAL